MEWLEQLWLANYKIPVGQVSKAAFDWLKLNFKGGFDFMSLVLEEMIDAILWCLSSPHPLIIVALAVALSWYLQRSWKICLLVLFGFLFILNQGYWEETLESLTMVRDALTGRNAAAADIVALNAGAAIYAANVVEDMAAGVQLAREILRSGDALRKLEALAAFSQSL